MGRIPPDPAIFERMLGLLCKRLTGEAQAKKFPDSKSFEKRVRENLQDLVSAYDVIVDFDPHPHIFPDIVLGDFGVEVKFTLKETWRSVANSVFEGTRSAEVQHIYIVFGKMGGMPEVQWGKYEDCVIHVRTSHVPRFEVEIPGLGSKAAKDSLFKKMGLTYRDFSCLPIEERMEHIRKYARGRLKKGERLWWLEERPEEGHTLPIQVRLYMDIPQDEKRKLRAEAALLCPQIVKPSRSKNKYDDAAIFLLTYHGVLCSQARDLFTAGSVALKADPKRGGNYIARSLLDIEPEMRRAAAAMDDKLFVEYWEQPVPRGQRIQEWLKRADKFADGWIPSNVLFQKKK